MVVEGPAELAEVAAKWTAERITRAVADRGACDLALAGELVRPAPPPGRLSKFAQVLRLY